jgi:hypothetical protein
MKKYDIVRMVCFKIFFVIPFLFELRTLIDWTFTPTSLTFAEWVRVEMIYAHVYDVKCRRNLNKNVPRGVKKSWLVKAFLGGGFAFLIIFILWLPMLFFAYTHSLGESTVPNKFSMEVKIRNFEPLYQMSIRADSMYRFKKDDLRVFKRLYEKDSRASAFLADYNEHDVALLQMNVNSSSVWNVSPPSFDKLLQGFENGSVQAINISYEFSQIGYVKDKDALLKFDHVLSREDNANLAEILKGNLKDSITLPAVFPKFINVANTGKVNLIPQLYVAQNSECLKNIFFLVDNYRLLLEKALRNLTITMYENEKYMSSWWKVQEVCNDTLYTDIIGHFFPHDCNKHINLFIFNEKSFPSQLSSFAVKG